MSIKREELIDFINEILVPTEYSDHCPNGLQIEGKESIKKISFAVSACKESITKAIENRSDCLIVHHGILWNYQGGTPITGPFGGRIIPLIKNDINLIGHHIPLDAHPEIGNNAAIASLLELKNQERFGEYKGSLIGIKGDFKKPIKPNELKDKLNNILNHDIIMASPDENMEINNIGIISGGANSNWKDALKNGLDAYLTGEISENNWHESQEAGINMFAGGHYATEQFGIKLLMNKISENFSVECTYISSKNPV
jgi:dinuclear metal center YbgI/SA1388 family protein